MRLYNDFYGTNAYEVKNFSKWILQLGKGKLYEPNDRNAEIDILLELLIPRTDKLIATIVQSTYPDILCNYMNIKFLKEEKY